MSVRVRQLQGRSKMAVTFGTDWGDYGSGHEGVTVSKHGRLVIVQGRAVKNGTPANGDIICMLPEICWPAGVLSFPAVTGATTSAGVVQVTELGDVIWRAGDATEVDFTDLSGVTYVV